MSSAGVNWLDGFLGAGFATMWLPNVVGNVRHQEKLVMSIIVCVTGWLEHNPASYCYNYATLSILCVVYNGLLCGAGIGTVFPGLAVPKLAGYPHIWLGDQGKWPSSDLGAAAMDIRVQSTWTSSDFLVDVENNQEKIT